MTLLARASTQVVSCWSCAGKTTTNRCGSDGGRGQTQRHYTRTMFMDITEQVLMEQEKARLEAQTVYLQEEIKGTHNFEELIGYRLR